MGREMTRLLGGTLLALALVVGIASPGAGAPRADDGGGSVSDPAPLTQSVSLSPAAAAALTPRLALGSRGPAVVHVQTTLGVTPASGYYGTLTRTAVTKLQKRSGLKATGRVTKATWKVLLAVGAPTDESEPPTADPAPDPGTTSPPAPAQLTPGQAAALKPTLRRGMGPGDPAVVYVQQYLRVSPSTGYFGTLTLAAVTAYQRALGISPTGTVGPLTWAAILSGRTAPAAPSPPGTPSTSPPTAPTTPTFTPPPDATPRQVALAFALAQVGKAYVLGGNGPDVFDCSGLVQQAYLAAGIALPRLASQQRFAGTQVSLEELLPGDLLYYQDGTSTRNGHISMYAGDGLAVEAANPRADVRVRDLDQAWYHDRFVAAVRIG